jgi:hypothetical protein
MKPSRSRPTSGRRAPRSLALAALAALLASGACNYGFSGGGGFPSSIRTVCIQPFDNQTDHSELTNELFNALSQKVPGALGLRPGDCKGGADAIISGKILRYDDAATNYSATQNPSSPQAVPGQVNQSQVSVTVGVQVVDTQRNVILWESASVQGLGTYDPSRGDATPGRTQAVDKLVQAIIDGAQSQW